MDQIQECRARLERLQEIIKTAEPHEVGEIGMRIERRKIMLNLLELKSVLGPAMAVVSGPLERFGIDGAV